MYSEEQGWYICGNNERLQIHHVVPQGYWVYQRHTNPNLASNGIALCILHHIGTGYKDSLDWHEEVVPIIHPDIEWARRRYDGTAKYYQQVFDGRDEVTQKGQTYWNTDWDSALEMIVDETVGRYMYEHPEDKFPQVNYRNSYPNR